MKTWTRMALLALLCNGLTCAYAQTQAPMPKELEGWQSWVQYGQEFRRCPFLANTDGSEENQRICAWPGRLNLDLNQGGGRFTQTWVSYAETWVPLPGSLEFWPNAVTVNGAAAAVVARAGIPQIRVQAGSSAIAAGFSWAKRPESLPIPPQTGLISLSLDGHQVDQVDRPDGNVWLGKRHEAEVAQQLEVQVYRLLSDGIPAMLNTRLDLQIAGDAREETLPKFLPQGFQPMSLDSQLPARLDADGRLHVQVRAGSWTIAVVARGADNLATITVPAAEGKLPKQEVWSYSSDDRLRVAALDGADSIDPAQANVPQEWRRYPSYRVAAGGAIKLVERSRGFSPQEGNHLALQRQLYLDFGHGGFTVIDQISGQMRAGWRLDMQAPYRLMRANSGTDNLLVTQGEGSALTGVELRNPTVNLATTSRIEAPGGAIPASGWKERFDHVSGVLRLPPGHRLLAAFGADSVPDAWLELWGLLDLFLLLIATVIALRLFGRMYAAVVFAAVTLLHQENPWLVWLTLLVLLAIAAARAAPAGWPQSALSWSRKLLLGVLLLVSVPFAFTQLRFALYPQLADPPVHEVAETQTYGLGALVAEPVWRRQKANRAAANYAPPPPASYAAAPAPRLEELALDKVTVTAGRARSDAKSASSSEPRQRYAAGTLVQAGPGVPRWNYVAYEFAWSGPVDAAQSVHFIIMPPGLVGLWRVLGIALLAALILRLARSSFDAGVRWPGPAANRTTAAWLLAAFACTGLAPWVHASSTPDPELLNDLKARLSQPSKCVPNCAEIMSARVALTPTRLEANLEIAALSTVAVALPTTGQKFDPDSISVDGAAVSGVYRDAEQQIWIALKPGAHSVKLSAPLPASDSVQLLFPQVPRVIAVSGEGWDVSGVNAGRLLGNTIGLLHRPAAGHAADTPQAGAQFPPFVRIRRDFTFDLDWSMQTTVQRLAPERGGFTLEIPLLAGESVLTNGIETNDATRVSAGFDSNADEFSWRSALPQSGALTLTAAKDRPWSEVWIFRVSPLWRVEFSGVPAVMPENLAAGDWTFEYHPRAGESLALKVSRPGAAPGGTLAVDNVSLYLDVGKRSSNVTLSLNYRSTQGGRHSVGIPETARVTGVKLDGAAVPVRPEKGQLPLALLPGAHQVIVQWESSGGGVLRTTMPSVDLQVPSSNVRTLITMHPDRWVLFAAGSGVGPAILYWGELIVFVLLAVLLGRSGLTPLRRGEWLLLGLGLSTFSWFVLLLFAVWMYAMQRRRDFPVQSLRRGRFNVLQSVLILLSLAAVVSLVAAIPFGLLGSPDMRIDGSDQGGGQLSWFNDQAPGVLPAPWVLSVSIWWYKAAMLLWALWLAFALARWLPAAWRALGQGGFWRRAAINAPPVL